MQLLYDGIFCQKEKRYSSRHGLTEARCGIKIKNEKYPAMAMGNRHFSPW